MEDIKKIINNFTTLYHGSKTWPNTFWLGVSSLKPVTDLWIYQEIIYETKPDIIIECGTAQGGSALFMASICELIKQGKVITIDMKSFRARPQHPYLIYLQGISVDPKTVTKVSEIIGDKKSAKVMVILDSDHHKDHVLKEMQLYAPIVTSGCYLIVEDTGINGNLILPDFGPGPMEAVDEFMKTNKNFIIDRDREKFLLTFHPKGYLKKIT